MEKGCSVKCQQLPESGSLFAGTTEKAEIYVKIYFTEVQKVMLLKKYGKSVLGIMSIEDS
jgi:hypothetical protein